MMVSSASIALKAKSNSESPSVLDVFCVSCWRTPWRAWVLAAVCVLGAGVGAVGPGDLTARGFRMSRAIDVV